ncbi:uncharacterized protein DSM5745_03205 [Aspergillus mulundensis]|uniref:Integrase catalytic domain-containing protein n=1 Tax=Aspergillus mulundensis TaxID=1810919 RepID=A0A3D8SJT0_9EURO|nr:hypothetical protein DSM5745_03205 [Aspergillus mulundensis]RDW86563.1 hypothetical protein DSM5745_03205 [Aspergillus mulundensis]
MENLQFLPANARFNAVTLDGPDTWRPWYQITKSMAIGLMIWDYIDPAVDDKDLPPIPVGPRPILRDYCSNIPEEGELQISHLTANEQGRFHIAMEKHLTQKKKHEAPLGTMTAHITSTVSSSHQQLLYGQEHPRAMLQLLVKRHTQSDIARRTEIKAKWREAAIHRGLSTKKQIDNWCNRWVGVFTEARKFNVFTSDQDTDALQDFVYATTTVDKEFSRRLHMAILSEEKKNFTDAVEEFRVFHTLWAVHTAYSKSGRRPMDGTFATLGENDSADEKDENTKDDKKSKKNGKDKDDKSKVTCPACGHPHFITSCWYLNAKRAPKDWEPQEETLQKVKENMRDPTIKKRVLSAFKRSRFNTMTFEIEAEKNDSKDPEKVMMTIAYSLSNSSRYGLYKSVIADSGSSIHVTNDLTKMIDIRDASEDDVVLVGNTVNKIEKFGTLRVSCKGPDGSKRLLKLKNCAYVPGFHTTIVSLDRAVSADLYFSGRKRTLEDSKGTDFCVLERHHGLYTLYYEKFDIDDDEEIKASYAAMETKIRRSATPKTLSGSPKIWHERMGHLNANAVSKLPIFATGIQIDPAPQLSSEEQEEEPLCAPCKLSQFPKQISRVESTRATRPFERIYFDILTFEASWNNMKYASHFLDDATRMRWIVLHAEKNDCQRAVQSLDAYAFRQFGLHIQFLHMDNETSQLSNDFKFVKEQWGLAFETTVPDTPEQNGASERSGGIILQRARALLLAANMPRNLVSEAMKASVYILNRTPTRDEKNKWFVPLQKFRALTGNTRPVNIANVFKFGSLAYWRPKIPDSHKMEPRAAIGYLCGYEEAHNIWRIWNPRAKATRYSVIRARDVVFDEARTYDENDPIHTAGLRYAIPAHVDEKEKEKLVDIPFLIGFENDSPELDDENEPTPEPNDIEMGENEEVENDGPHAEIDAQNEAIPNSPGNLISHDDGNPAISLIPAASPSLASTAANQSSWTHNDYETIPTTPDWVVESEENEEILNSKNDSAGGLPQPENETDENDDGEETPTPLSPEESDLEPHETDIEEGEWDPNPRLLTTQVELDREARYDRLHRKRDPKDPIDEDRPRRRPPPKVFYTELLHRPAKDFTGYYISLHSAISKPPGPLREAPGEAIHRDQLQKEPKNWAELMKHPYKNQFIEAARVEFGTLKELHTFEIVPTPKGKIVIPLTWVFKYKFDAAGYLDKFKARLCARGDLQPSNYADTAAATLAARLFRLMMALVAYFDLDVVQLDVINAFIQSFMDEEVYVETPPGPWRVKGRVFKLNRPLYGLRRSPRIWQKEISSTLLKYGFKPVPEEPCLFVTKYLMVIFFVDDILVMSKRSAKAKKEAANFIEYMERTYKLRNLGEAKWFLNIRIIRDRHNRRIQLLQDSYIDSLQAKYNLTAPSRIPKTPLPTEKLTPAPPDYTPTKQDILLYQQLVGSFLYPTTMTRPDASKAASELAQHMMRPTKTHIEAAKYAIQYLIATKDLGIEYSANTKEIIAMASDASFGDNPNRRSSDGWLMKLFGGPIDWNARKQKTVTTSTTEAELLAVTEGAKNLIWWRRLFNAIKFDPEVELRLLCDNAQTVRLLNSDDPAFTTRLRHVDIHRHWLREKCQNGEIKVDWIETKDQPADGLTKLLSGPRHETFIRQLGLVKIEAIPDA